MTSIDVMLRAVTMQEFRASVAIPRCKMNR